jgi:putative aminopeptidase FrvX
MGEMKMDERAKMMQALSEVDGVPGYERDVRLKMEEFLQPISDEILKDRLGSVVGKKTGQADGPRVLVAGHMDEVGWMVTFVTKEGFLRFQPLGGWWPNVMLAQRVRIKGSKGDIVGVIGSKPPHALSPEERNKAVPIKEMFIDIGARSKDEVEEWGIRPGDPITPVAEFFEMRGGEVWAGKALDNRAGCGVAIEVLKALQGVDHPNVVYSGGTVQEEVGTRGALTLANVVQPDIAIAVDVGLAYDTPGFETHDASCNIGDGPLVLLFDLSMIPHAGLRHLVFDTAKEIGINVQVDALAGGGTDAAKFHLNNIGCPSIAIGFATRYIHSHTALLSRKDFEQAAELITALIKKLDRKTVDALHNY